MPFPTSDRVIFDKNPLAEVVCELRFPPILRIIADPPADFQERIRDEYPVFQQTPGNQAFPVTGPGVPIEGNFNFGWQQPTFSFASETGTRTITLTQESLSIAERKYERWEQLRSEIERAKRELEAVYGPSFYGRVGLRYQNIISRGQLGLADVPWRELLNPVFAGLLGSDASVSDHVIRSTAIGELNVPDLTASKVQLRHGLLEMPEPQLQHYAIDCDFFSIDRSEPANVTSILDSFHVHAGNLFRWAISDRLRDALGPTELPTERQTSAA